MSIAVGAKLPPTAAVARIAVDLELAGFDSLWVSDHVALPEHIGSTYPFEADGVARWPTDAPALEALVALAAAAAVTRKIRLGTAVLVLPQRNPVLLAKQVASIDALCPGRLALGVGAGWLREEFEALGASFNDRGSRMSEWISLLRACWTGRPRAQSTARYSLPPDMLLLPAPAVSIPVYVGGHSPAALSRAGRIGDGWLGQQSLDSLDPAQLAVEISQVRGAALHAGRDPGGLRVVLRIVDSVGRARDVAARMPELAAVGVQEIVVDSDPEGDPAADAAVLHAVAG